MTQLRRAHALMPLALVCVVLSTSARAQWTVSSLHPSIASSSQLLHGSGEQQVGILYQQGRSYQACLWRGTADSWVSLHPPRTGIYSPSSLIATDGEWQVGNVSTANGNHAFLWHGTAASARDLNPTGSTSSVAVSMTSWGGGQQVGYAQVSADYHAFLWRGTAASAVDLNPLGARYSQAWGADGGQQVGFTVVGSSFHACLWNGTAATWVDLNPAGIDESFAYATNGAQQGGNSRLALTVINRACMWSGTSESFVDLHPDAHASRSSVLDMNALEQVGWAEVGGEEHACIWNGTAGSWFDLHTILPGRFQSSRATGIVGEGDSVTITGWGYNLVARRGEALLWTRMQPRPCPADFNRDGFLDFFDYAEFVNAFESSEAEADFNDDGFVDLFDYIAFVAAFETEC